MQLLVRAVRQRKGMTLRELAARIARHATGIGKIETDINVCTLPMLGRLAHGLDCHPEELVNWDDEFGPAPCCHCQQHKEHA